MTKSGNQVTAWRRSATTLRACIAGVAWSVVVGCGAPEPPPEIPMASTTVTPVERTPPPPPSSALPPAPAPLPLEVRAPNSMLLRVEGEDAGARVGLSQGEDGVWRWSLTLDDCSFRELEARVVPSDGERCATFAQRRFDERAQVALRVPAGSHEVTVTNRGPADAGGLWVREIDDASMTAVTGGGALRDVATTYRFELAEGSYRLSCPLTPTPDYLLLVSEPVAPAEPVETD